MTRTVPCTYSRSELRSIVREMSALSWVLVSLGIWMILGAVELAAGDEQTASAAPSPSSTPSEIPPTSTTEDPVQKHLSVIVGVPTGIGLSLLLIGSCITWLVVSAYLNYRRAEREHNTHSTNLNSTFKGGKQHAQHSSDPSNDVGGPFHTLPDSPRSPPPPSEISATFPYHTSPASDTEATDTKL